MMERGLRSQPFSDSILRDMAIRFPKGKNQMLCDALETGFLTVSADKNELLAIPGIDSEKVELFGSRFLHLIRLAQQHCEDLKCEQNGVVHDPNHDTVIAISSDDEFSDDDLFADGVSNLDLDNNIASKYFDGECNDSISFHTQPLCANSNQLLKIERLAATPTVG